MSSLCAYTGGCKNRPNGGDFQLRTFRPRSPAWISTAASVTCSPAHPKRSDLPGRRFGVELLGNPGFVASRGRGTRDARGEPPRGYGSWLLRGSACLPMFPVCRRSNSRIANSSISEPYRRRSNAPRLSRAEDGTGGSLCVSCCNRVHDLRSELDGRIADEERPVHVESEGIIAATAGKSPPEKKYLCSELPKGVVRRCQEYAGVRRRCNNCMKSATYTS